MSRRQNANNAAAGSTTAAATAADGETKRAAGSQIIRPPNAILNGALTAAYLASVAWTYIIFAREGSITYLTALVAATAVAIVICRYVSRVIGVWISRGLLGSRDPLSKASAMHKWQDQCWQFAIHVSMTALEVYVLSDEKWWQDTAQCWIPAPALQPLKESARFLYLSQLAIWIYTGFSHRFVEEYHKDYVVMFVHHIATIALIAGSHVMGYQRIGILVLFVHDASDITVDLLKLTNYLDLSGSNGAPIVEVVFAVNLISWIYYRLWLYPVHVLAGSGPIAHRTLAPALPGHMILPHPLFPYFTINSPFELWTFTNCLLCLLLFLHCWWFLLFLRLAVKLLFQPAHEAGREEYEGDSDHDSTHEESTSARIIRQVCSTPVVLFVSAVMWVLLLAVMLGRDRAAHP